MKRAAILLVLLLAAPSCARQAPIHPGAVSTFDSQVYDSLLIYQASLDQIKTEIQLGRLPPAAKGPTNKAGETYNALRSAWFLYRTDPTQQAQAQQLILDLSKRLNDLITQIRGMSP